MLGTLFLFTFSFLLVNLSNTSSLFRTMNWETLTCKPHFFILNPKFNLSFHVDVSSTRLRTCQLFPGLAGIDKQRKCPLINARLEVNNAYMVISRTCWSQNNYEHLILLIHKFLSYICLSPISPKPIMQRHWKATQVGVEMGICGFQIQATYRRYGEQPNIARLKRKRSFRGWRCTWLGIREI